MAKKSRVPSSPSPGRRTQISRAALVHSLLEHGGVAIECGAKVDPSRVARINDFYLESRETLEPGQ